jgi:hypothetical protein
MSLSIAQAGACLATSVLLLVMGARSSAHLPASQHAPSGSTMSGVFTAAQAGKGEELYMTLCTGCHAGGTYASLGATWTGRPVLEMFDLLQQTMPKNDPGSLTDAETARIVAYMLKINRVPVGKSELPSTSGTSRSGSRALLVRIRQQQGVARDGTCACDATRLNCARRDDVPHQNSGRCNTARWNFRSG